MKPRTLLVVALLSLFGIGLAWALRSRPAAATGGSGEYAAPELRDRVNDVARIEIETADQAFHFRRDGDAWVCEERSDHPVETSEVRKLLMGLRDLELRERKTARPERLGELQLALDTEEASRRGRVVRLWFDGEDEPAVTLVVGRTRWTPSRGTYVRRGGEDQAWFADGEVRLPTTPEQWMDTEIVNLNPADVARVHVERDGESLTIERDSADGDWRLVEQPDDRELVEHPPFATLGNLLGYLNFEGVARADDARFQRDPDFTAFVETFDGRRVDLRGWVDEDGAVWVALSAPEDVSGLDDWRERWDGWVFRIPQWKAESLTIDWSKWLAPEGGEDAAEAGDTAPSGTVVDEGEPVEPVVESAGAETPREPQEGTGDDGRR